MWQAQLTLSYRLLILSTLFYGALTIYCCMLCWQYECIVLILPILIVLLSEYRRSYHYIFCITGDFAIQPAVRQIYWQQQRWLITGRPLFLGCWVILKVTSLRSGKRCGLWLSSDHLSQSDWRSCCYYLHRMSDSF